MSAPREIDVRLAAIGGAFATALVGLFSLATSGPVGPLPIAVLVLAMAAGAFRVARHAAAAAVAPDRTLLQFRGIRLTATGSGTLLLALLVVPTHALISGSWLLGGIDLLVLLLANRLLALREGGAVGQVLLVSLLMLMSAAVLTLRVEFLGAVFLFCLAGTWTAIFRTLHAGAGVGQPERQRGWGPGGEAPGNQDARVPRRIGALALASGVAVFASTVALFMVLPRLRLSAMQGGLLQVEGVSGFGDEVDLGAIGAVMIDRTPVMRVSISGKKIDESQLYWRGTALDHYQGGRWTLSDPFEQHVEGSISATENPLTRQFRVRDGRPAASADVVVQDVTLEPLDVTVLFALPVAQVVRADVPMIARNSADAILFRAKRFGRTHYVVESARVQPPDAELADRAAIAPGGAPDRWLEVPDALRAQIEPVARALAGEGSAWRRARRIESALQSWNYSLEVPKSTRGDPVATFLLDSHVGWCEQYASGMTLMLRTLGIPARVVNGFHGGEHNDIGDYWLVRKSDAHEWVEVPFEGYGWVAFDPTPGSAVETRPVLGPLSRVWDYLKLVWSQRVVEYNLLDQFELVASGLESGHRFAEQLTRPGRGRRMPWKQGAGALAALAVLAGAIVLLRRRAAAMAPPGMTRAAAEAERWWREVEASFRARGFERRAGETAAELATRAGRAEWAALYYRLRFAVREATGEERAEMERIRREIVKG